MPETAKCPTCGTPIPEGAPQGICPQCLLAKGMKPGTVAGENPLEFEAPAPEEIARQLPSFEDIELISRGGMGAAYGATAEASAAQQAQSSPAFAVA